MHGTTIKTIKKLMKAIFGYMKKKMTPVWNVFLAVKTNGYSFDCDS
jgi:hypothetical protein